MFSLRNVSMVVSAGVLVCIVHRVVTQRQIFPALHFSIWSLPIIYSNQFWRALCDVLLVCLNLSIIRKLYSTFAAVMSGSFLCSSWYGLARGCESFLFRPDPTNLLRGNHSVQQCNLCIYPMLS